MNLNIHLWKRDDTDTHIAIVCGTNELYSNAGAGGGTTEREAIQQAVNSYFNRKENSEAAQSVVSRDAEEPLPGNEATSPLGIKLLLERAIHFGRDIRIDGTKVTGVTYEDRRVFPLAIKRGSLGLEYLRCDDYASDSDRTFRLDGISRVVML